MTVEERDAIRLQVIASRIGQGLPATVQEATFLAQLAAAILEESWGDQHAQ